MNHKYRGKAIIFNHIKFQDEDLPEREGAERDVKRLKKTLLKLGFIEREIEVLTDPSYSDISKKLDNCKPQQLFCQFFFITKRCIINFLKI